MSKARSLAEKAIQLDDTLAEAHTSLGYIHDDSFNWNEAEREYEKAIGLNPTGRHEEAIEHARQAEELDPLSPAISIAFGQALLYGPRFDEAIRHLEQKVAGGEDSSSTHFILGIAYFYRGLYERAAEEERNFLAQEPMHHRGQTVLAISLAKMGKESEAKKILADLQKAGGQFALQAMIHLELGEKESAIECLEKVHRGKEPGLGFITVIPTFDVLRSDSRFVEILRGMNLPIEP
jgi:tetratricopeptide (TPR) repeat protein